MGQKSLDPNGLNEINLRDIAPQLLGQQPARHPAYDVYTGPTGTGKTPSFTVYPDHAFDFGAGQHYTRRQFLETFSNQPIDLPTCDPRPRRPAKPAHDLAKFKKAAQGAYPALHRALLNQAAVLDYVTIRRGNPAHFGYAAHTIKIGRGKLPQHALCIFYRDAAGEIVRIKYRLPLLNDDGSPDGYARALGLSSSQVARANPENKKYSQVAGGDPKAPYIIAGNDVLLLVEGEFDTETAAASGYSAATRGSATDRWSLEQANAVIDQIQPSVIIHAQDNDPAGNEAAAHSLGVFEIAAPHLAHIRLTLPDGVKDISEWVDRGGNLSDLIENHRAGGVGLYSFHPLPPRQPNPTFKQSSDHSNTGGVGYSYSSDSSHCPPCEQIPINPTNGNQNTEPEPEFLPPLETIFKGLALDGQYVWSQGVPDVLRTCFLNIDQIDQPIRQKGAKAKRYFKNHTPALIIYELIHRGAASGKIDPEQFTRDDLRAYAAQNGLTITEYTFELGLKQLIKIGFSRNLHPIEIQENTLGAKITENPQTEIRAGGRPVDMFALLPIRQALNTLLSRIEIAIRQAVYADLFPDIPANIETKREYIDLLNNVDQTLTRGGHPEQQISRLYGTWADRLSPKTLATAQSTPLAAGFDWGSKSGYTDALNRGKLDAIGGPRQTPNKILASELGCSENALRASNKRANILSMENYEYVEIEPGASRQKVESVLLGRGRAWWIADGFEYEKAIKPERLWSEIDHIADIVDKGGTVTVRIQTASIHTPSTPEQIEAVTAARREKLRAIRAYREMNTPQDAAPVETIPTPAKVEIMPRPVDALADGVTLQYILDQYALRIRVLDFTDPRRERLINRYVELGGNAMPFVDRSQPREKETETPPPPRLEIKPTPTAATKPNNAPSDVPEWVKRMTSKKAWERGA